MPELIVFILGTVIGSFLNVCIYRIPRGESVVFPGSHCPACSRRLGPVDLVPILSYLVLRGRCRTCTNRISPRYPLIELLTGVLFLVAWYLTGPVPAVFNYWLLSSILVVVTFIDLEHYLIPNKVIAVGAVLQLVLNFFTHQISLTNAGLGFLVGGGLLLVIALVSRGGMGGGDIKLAALLGLFLGWQNVLLGFFAASLAGALTGILLVALKKKGRKDAVPFGPFLSLGALLSLYAGQQLLDWYLSIYF